ncbi:MAG: hypothetical protein KDC26_02225 [Armatimonadetes bacterium]|nr:hypothetical protein [Armatimonadota bacterium]
MRNTSRIWFSVLAIATLAGLAVASLDWSRQYVGKSALSMELPGELTADTTEVIEDKNDWVASTTDYILDSENIVLFATVFNGREKVKADHKKLADVMVDLIVGIGEDTAKVELSKDGKSIEVTPKVGVKQTTKISVPKFENGLSVDGRPMLKATVALKQEDGDSVIKIALVGDGRNVYSIFGFAGNDDKEGNAAIDRIMNSIRFKRDIK